MHLRPLHAPRQLGSEAPLCVVLILAISGEVIGEDAGDNAAMLLRPLSWGVSVGLCQVGMSNYSVLELSRTIELCKTHGWKAPTVFQVLPLRCSCAAPCCPAAATASSFRWTWRHRL